MVIHHGVHQIVHQIFNGGEGPGVPMGASNLCRTRLPVRKSATKCSQTQPKRKSRKSLGFKPPPNRCAQAGLWHKVRHKKRVAACGIVLSSLWGSKQAAWQHALCRAAASHPAAVHSWSCASDRDSLGGQQRVYSSQANRRLAAYTNAETAAPSVERAVGR